MTNRKQEIPKNHKLKSKRADRPRRRPPARGKGGHKGDDLTWLYGLHSVGAALKNPERHHIRLLLSKNAQASFQASIGALPPGLTPEIVSARELTALLPEGAVHQGAALLAHPLHEKSLSDLHPMSQDDLVVILDQVSDPHNVGAILRSAAAFGAKALILQSRHSPTLSGVLAKAASGALEHVPIIHVTNIARTLGELEEMGVACLGLAEEGEIEIGAFERDGPVALVLGAEGSGLRRLTRETCTHLVRLPTSNMQSSLNVSNAAAVSLYALTI